MTIDPVLAYAGPESTSFDVLVIRFDGTAATVRGVLRNFATSAGEAGAPFTDAGPVLWIAFDGDVGQIEFVQYIEPGTGRLLHRRVTKRERTSGNYTTVKLNLSSEATTMPTQRDFAAEDFAAEDFG